MTASRAAERLCRLVGSTPIQVDDIELPITTSVGVAVSHPEMENFQDIVESSDQAVYQAKRLGKNRVHMSAPVAS